MANETEQRIVYIRVDSQAAIDGSRAYTSALDRMERAQASAGASLDRVEQSLNRVGGYLKAQLALMVAEVGGRLFQMAKDSLNAAAGLDELADQLGITTKGLQSLQFAAVQNGVKLDQLETGIGKFSQKIGEAADGSKTMIESLDRLGVKILDAKGKLLPTEAIMQNVAKAIMAIEDPAQRAAAAVDFFGKAGTRMLPLLPDIARGFAEMGAAAQKAGAIISAEAIAKLDKLSDAGERSRLVMRALFAENAAGPLTEILDFVSRKIENLSRLINAAKNDLTVLLGIASNPVGALASIIGSSPQEKLAETLRARQSDVADMERNLSIARTERDKKRMQDALEKANAELAKVQRQVDVANVGGKVSAGPGDPDNIGIYVAPKVVAGVKNPAVAGAGQAQAEAIAKVRRETELSTEAELAFADASTKGARAVADLEIHFKALKAAQDAYGKTADSNKAGVAALTAELEKQMKAAERAKNLKDFNLGTEELERSNKLLEAENRLINATTQDRARELALIRLKNEAASKGLDESNEKEREALERRREALEVNETLKAQGEQIRQAQELWTEPLKRALQDIQSTAADAFESMLESGKFNFEELGKVFKRIIIRMAAEFLALATVRPVMTVLVNAAGSAGILSPAQVQGLGGSGNYGGGMPGFGGGGLFGGSNFGFLNQPIFGPNTMRSAADISFAPTQAAMNSAMSNSSGWLNNITWGQGLGAAAGFGMGAFQLANSKSTSQTIGGIGSMVGSIVSLLPIPGAQIIGPAIGLLSNIIPGFLGLDGKKEPPTMRATGGLNFSGGKFTTSGGAYGGASSVLGTLGGVGDQMQALLKAAGFSATDSPWGLTYQTIAKGDFNSASTFINGKQWGQGSGADAGLDTAAAHIAHKMMMEPGSGISAFMREGLGGYGQKNLEHAFSMEELATAVSELKSLETVMKDLGRTVPAAEEALRGIDEQFKTLKESAEKYGLDTAKIDAEKVKAQTKVATDFAEGLQRAIDEMNGDAATGALADLEKERQAAIDNNKAILEANIGAKDQILKIEELFNAKRIELAKSAWETVPALAKSQAEFVQRQALTETLRAYNDDTAAMSANPMATQIKAWQRESGLFAKGVGDTFGIGSGEYRDATIAASMRLAAQMKAANDNFRAGLDAMTRELEGAGVANIKNLMDARARDIATATALDGPFFDGILQVGENVVKATKAWNAKIFRVADDFRYSVSQGLLAFSNPLQAAINDNNRERDEAMATAKANNAAVEKINQEQIDRLEALDKIRTGDLYAIKVTNELAARERRALTESEALNIEKWTREAELAKSVAATVGAELAAAGDHFVAMADITELYLQKEKKLKEDYYAATITGLEELIKRITYGDLSGASSLTVLNANQANYAAVRAQAFAGDQTGLNNFSSTAGEYLTAARDYFAYTPEYFALLEQIKRDAQELNTTLKAGNAPSGTAAVSPDVAALMQRLDRAQADNDNLARTIAQLLAKADRQADLLERLVVNQR